MQRGVVILAIAIGGAALFGASKPVWGLSVAEAGRIQPGYGADSVGEGDDDAVDSDVALTAVGLGAVSLATTAVNFVRPSTASGFLGLVAGTASIIFGATHLDDEDEYGGTDRIAAVSIGLGAVSLGAGIYGILDARRHHDGWRDRVIYRRRRGHEIRVIPDLGVQRSEPRVGLLVNGRF